MKKSFFSSIILLLYQIKGPLFITSRIQKLLRRIVYKLEGGEWQSSTIREIYKRFYGINVGIATYGVEGIEANPGSTIGNYSSIARCVKIVNNHEYTWGSTHPLFYYKGYGYVIEEMLKWPYIEIGHDVWIGENVLITNGCRRIGNGAVIAAGSIVTRDVEPYGIYVGVPAKKIKDRFDKKVIDKLEKSEWYLLAPDMLFKYSNVVKDPELFADSIISDKETKEQK